jgi:peptidoglycan/xylan/chitin deacetylase (PgdA/CDA1 family)
VREVLGGKARMKVVALTADDGPRPDWTPQVLDLLAENEVHAAFSLVGSQAQAYPKLVRCIARAGHRLGNYTMTHPQPSGAGPTGRGPSAGPRRARPTTRHGRPAEAA